MAREIARQRVRALRDRVANNDEMR